MITQEWQLNLLLDLLADYVKAISINSQSRDVEDAVNESNRREDLKRNIMKTFDIEPD